MITIRELLGDYLLKEVLTDDWRLLLTPASAHILLGTAVKEGKHYRGNGELFFTRLNGAFANRHIDALRVRTYAKKMITRDSDGTLEWKDRITEIGVSPEGVLAMGFHACLAVILSDTIHEVRLLSNFTESERNSEGTGRKQDFGDVLFYYGIPNAKSAAALMQMMANHRRTLSPLNSITPGSVRNTNTELLAILNSQEMPLVSEAVAYSKTLAVKFASTAGKYRKRSAVAPASVAHLYLEWMQQHPAEAEQFFEGLRTGQGISGPVLTLRERLSAIAGGNGSSLDGVLNPYVRTATLMGIAWKRFLAGDTGPSKIQMSNPPSPILCETHHP